MHLLEEISDKDSNPAVQATHGRFTVDRVRHAGNMGYACNLISATNQTEMIPLLIQVNDPLTTQTETTSQLFHRGLARRLAFGFRFPRAAASRP